MAVPHQGPAILSGNFNVEFDKRAELQNLVDSGWTDAMTMHQTEHTCSQGPHSSRPDMCYVSHECVPLVKNVATLDLGWATHRVLRFELDLRLLDDNVNKHTPPSRINIDAGSVRFPERVAQNIALSNGTLRLNVFWRSRLLLRVRRSFLSTSAEGAKMCMKPNFSTNRTNARFKVIVCIPCLVRRRLPCLFSGFPELTKCVVCFRKEITLTKLKLPGKTPPGHW